MMNWLKFMNIIQDDDTELIEYLNQSARLIDVRTTGEFNAGSAEGAINIPMNEIPARFEEIDRDKPTIVFCRSGNRSEEVKMFLEAKGYTKIKNGGAWQTIERLIEEHKKN